MSLRTKASERSVRRRAEPSDARHATTVSFRKRNRLVARAPTPPAAASFSTWRFSRKRPSESRAWNTPPDPSRQRFPMKTHRSMSKYVRTYRIAPPSSVATFSRKTQSSTRALAVFCMASAPPRRAKLPSNEHARTSTDVEKREVIAAPRLAPVPTSGAALSRKRQFSTTNWTPASASMAPPRSAARFSRKRQSRTMRAPEPTRIAPPSLRSPRVNVKPTISLASPASRKRSGLVACPSSTVASGPSSERSTIALGLVSDSRQVPGPTSTVSPAAAAVSASAIVRKSPVPSERTVHDAALAPRVDARAIASASEPARPPT